MNVIQLIDELRLRVPEDAPIGARWKGATVVAVPGGVHQVAAAARIDAKGRRREQFWCDEVRVERAVLLRLTCVERECPHVQQVSAQWAAFHQRGGAAPRPQPPLPRPLMEEVVVTIAGRRVNARPARFPCYTPCPNRAHSPLTIEKKGYDLFDAGMCLGGGVFESGGVRRPRLPTVQSAEAWLLARHLETLAIVGVVRDASRGRSGPGAGGE